MKAVAEVEYRPAERGDLPTMVDLFRRAVTDLYQRNGVNAVAPPVAAILTAYEYVLRTGVFRVAQIGDRIAGIAGAVVRDHLWFLSAFWVHPDYQRRGIGMPLLREVREKGQDLGASIFFTWSSIDPTALAAYMKLGMYPGYPVFWFDGTPTRVPEVPKGYLARPLEARAAAELDLDIRGTKRECDHEFWAGLGFKGRKVLNSGRVVGYYYHLRGFVGPAAWVGPDVAEAVLALAIREAMEGAAELRVAVPGINHAALRFILGTGMRLGYHAFFLSSAPFGRLEDYLPSGQTLY